MEYEEWNPFMEDIKLKQIFTDVCPNKIKKIIWHPERPWFLAWDSKSNVTLWEYEGCQKLLSTFTTNSLIKDSSGIKLPPLGVSLKGVCFHDEYTIKWNSLSRMGFAMSKNYQTNDQIGKDSPYSFIIFVFEHFIVFHDYKTKVNKYLQKTEIDSKGFSSCVGVSQDFVAIGSTGGWITMFKISDWSVGRLLSKGYHTKSITWMDTLIRWKQSYIISASSDGVWAVWAPFSSVGTPIIKYQGFKGESFSWIHINRLEETLLWVGSSNTIGIWNIKDGSELYKVRGIKTLNKSTIINWILCLYQFTTTTTIIGMAKDSTLELIETNQKALITPVKGSSGIFRKNTMAHIRTMFDLNSFLKIPVKGMKVVDASYSSFKPYWTLVATSKEVYFLEIKRNSIPSGWVLGRKIIGNKISMDLLVCKNKRVNNVELELDIEKGVVSNSKINLKNALESTYSSDTQIKISPWWKYYSIEYIDDGVYEIYINSSGKSKSISK